MVRMAAGGKMKTLFKLIAIVVAIWSISLTLTTIAWYGNEDHKRAGVLILNYHQVTDTHYSALTMHPKAFHTQMKYLKNNGYHPITTKQLDDYLTKGMSLPDKPVLITFDDGYEDNYKYAYPILKEFNFPATIYMIGEAIDQPRFLKTEQIKELLAYGIEIESHTYSHIPLNEAKPEELRKDLELLKATFLEKFGYEPKYIAYPRGFTSEENLKVIKQAGYRLGFTVNPGSVDLGEDLFNIQRTPIFEVPYRNLCFVFRLHFPELVGDLWHFRNYLIKNGHENIANRIPTF